MLWHDNVICADTLLRETLSPTTRKYIGSIGEYGNIKNNYNTLLGGNPTRTLEGWNQMRKNGVLLIRDNKDPQMTSTAKENHHK